MSEKDLDQLLRRITLDAGRLERGGLPEETHTFSPAFEQKMRKLLRRGKHLLRHRTLRAAACLLLALLLSGCAVLAVSPEARAAFTGWVREAYENAFVYRFHGAEKAPSEDLYCLTYVPPGYQITQSVVEYGLTTVEYRRGAEELLVFTRVPDTMASVFQIERDGLETYQQVLVNEMPAELYLDQEEGQANVLLWWDEARDSIFRISAPEGKAELLKMAESVEAVEEIPESPLADRQLTWVPAGYRQSDCVRLTGQSVVLYQNDRGDLISFGYLRDSAGAVPHVVPSGEEKVVPRTVLVNGEAADLYLEEGADNVLIWGEDGLFFFLQGDCSEEELVAMAESQEVVLPDRSGM